MISWRDFIKENSLSPFDCWSEVPSEDVSDNANAKILIETKELKKYFVECVLVTENKIKALEAEYNPDTFLAEQRVCDELRGVLKTYKELAKGLEE